MDKVIVERKLDSLRRCLARLHAKAPSDVTQLRADIDLQDVLVLNLSRAVQLCVDMAAHVIAGQAWPPPNTMGEAFDRLAEHGLIPADLALRLKQAVGFRNVAVHAYDTLDWDIVFAISTLYLGDFEAFARMIARQLDGDAVTAR